jgi:hypothetical protein
MLDNLWIKLGPFIMEALRKPEFYYAITIFWFFVMLMITFWLGRRRGELNWTDMLTENGKLSADKFMQMVGGIVVTWVIVKYAQDKILTSDLLLVYLAYVGGMSAFRRFVMAKYNMNGSSFNIANELPPGVEKDRRSPRKSKPAASVTVTATANQDGSTSMGGLASPGQSNP